MNQVNRCDLFGLLALSRCRSNHFLLFLREIKAHHSVDFVWNPLPHFFFASLFSRRNSKLKTRYVKLLKSTEAENGQANRKCLVQSKVHEGSVRLNPCLYRHQVTNPDVNQGSHLQSRLQTPPPPPPSIEEAIT